MQKVEVYMINQLIKKSCINDIMIYVGKPSHFYLCLSVCLFAQTRVSIMVIACFAI